MMSDDIGVRTFADGVALDVAVAAYRDDGWRIRELPTGATNRRAFIQRAASVLPMDPPLVGMTSWDAFADSLWGGLVEASEGQVVLVWRDAAGFRTRMPGEFQILREVLADTAISLNDVEATCGQPVRFVVMWVEGT